MSIYCVNTHNIIFIAKSINTKQNPALVQHVYTVFTVLRS